MINESAKTLLNGAKDILTNAAEQLKEYEAHSKFQALLEAQLRKMNLVSREEFDAQQAILKRTRAKLDTLEQYVKQLESAQTGQTDQQ